MDLSPRVDSPDGKHNASISSCDLNSSKRSALLTVSDAAGKQTLQLPIEARPQMGESCIAGGELRWLNDERIAVTCKYDSMLNGYVVVNVKNASVEAQYTGLWFQPSPDGRTVAAVGVSQRYAVKARVVVFSLTTSRFTRWDVASKEKRVLRTAQKSQRTFSVTSIAAFTRF